MAPSKCGSSSITSKRMVRLQTRPAPPRGGGAGRLCSWQVPPDYSNRGQRGSTKSPLQQFRIARVRDASDVDHRCTREIGSRRARPRLTDVAEIEARDVRVTPRDGDRSEVARRLHPTGRRDLPDLVPARPQPVGDVELVEAARVRPGGGEE